MRTMFEPMPPLEFKKSVCKRKPPAVEGIAAMLKGKAGESLFEKGTPPPPEKFETPRQRHARIAAAKKKVRIMCTTRNTLVDLFLCVRLYHVLCIIHTLYICVVCYMYNWHILRTFVAVLFFFTAKVYIAHHTSRARMLA